MNLFKIKVSLIVTVWNIILSFINTKSNGAGYKIFFSDTLRSHKSIQAECERKNGTPACFKVITQRTQDYMLQLWKNFLESRNTTTSRVLPYAYIGLTENNLGVLIWWDQTELNESSTFPLYSRSLETDCGSLRFEQNRVDPIHIALYDCFTSLPFICEFKDSTFSTVATSTVDIFHIDGGLFSNFFWVTISFGLAMFLLLFIGVFVSVCRRIKKKIPADRVYRRSSTATSVQQNDDVAKLIDLQPSEQKVLKPILKNRFQNMNVNEALSNTTFVVKGPISFQEETDTYKTADGSTATLATEYVTSLLPNK